MLHLYTNNLFFIVWCRISTSVKELENFKELLRPLQWIDPDGDQLPCFMQIGLWVILAGVVPAWSHSWQERLSQHDHKNWSHSLAYKFIFGSEVAEILMKDSFSKAGYTSDIGLVCSIFFKIHTHTQWGWDNCILPDNCWTTTPSSLYQHDH